MARSEACSARLALATAKLGACRRVPAIGLLRPSRLLSPAASNMEIRTEIEIEAEPSKIWRVLTDFRSYPEWNPFIVSIEGELAPGARLALTTSEPESNRERSFAVRVKSCEPARELRWLGHRGMKGLLDGEHFLLLE